MKVSVWSGSLQLSRPVAWGVRMKKITCKYCGKRFASDDALIQHNKSKHTEELKEEKNVFYLSDRRKKKIKKMSIYTTALFIFGLFIFFFYSAVSNIKTYPPTSTQGHVESYPPSRIMDEPVPEPVQRHILEHVASSFGNRPGVLVQYNCEKFECEQDLVSKLESIVKDYDYVYLAPYPQMDAKMALTKAGKLEILDEFDEEKIVGFIGG